jgi:hypothetical protein
MDPDLRRKIQAYRVSVRQNLEDLARWEFLLSQFGTLDKRDRMLI